MISRSLSVPELDSLRALYPEAVPPSDEVRAHARALLDARFEPRVRRRRWLLATAGVAAAGIAVAFALVGVGVKGGGNASAATQVLRHAAAVARRQAPLGKLGRGQFLYVKSVNAYLNTVVPADSPGFSVLVPHVREVWLGTDGGLLRETDGAPTFLTSRDRTRWIAAGRPPVASARTTETKLGPLRPLDLPADPDALYTRLKHDAAGHGDGLYEEMFTLVGDSLRETNATPAQRAALYDVAARIPGVELVGTVRDPLGRRGIAVAMRHEDDGVRETLVLDPSTGELLSEEQVALSGNSFAYPAGAVVGHATYVTRGVVVGLTRP
jgi:hypothetical protein